MQKGNIVMGLGKGTFEEYSGYKGLRTTMVNAKIRYEEPPGGNGYVKIHG